MKNLILLCDSYPSAAGEFFIDDEMRVIANYFETIYVIVNSPHKTELNRHVPKNMIVHSFTDTVSIIDKITGIPYLFKNFFKEESKLAVQKYGLKPSMLLFKIMFMDVVRAIKIKKELFSIMKKEHLNPSNIIFYSYWHDYKALTLALMKSNNSSLVCVSRAHGWDVFFERHQPPYLPFKKFIVSNLDVTYSISKAGRKAFISLLGNNFNNKIAVSRLGKINHRLPIEVKNHHGILICSCSNIIPLKRIHLIIDLLSNLHFENIRWVHFGDGYLRPELEQLAKVKLQHIDFEFKGSVPNAEILEFYHDHYVDLFINLSESEGIPVSIMEALSAGIPVLATDVGGTSEAVNSNVGFLLPEHFEMTNAVKMVNDFFCLPEESKKRIRQNAYRFWRENFDATQNYSAFVETLYNIKP